MADRKTEAFPMMGGDGIKSYTKNSNFQRPGWNSVKEMINDAIAEMFDASNFLTTSNTINIADLGCSVGPNTFLAMKNVLDAVMKKCHSQLGLASKDVEYQVFFNDHYSNDFNTLFTSIPPDRQYYAAGVPGSFYDRLFPKRSLHFVYSAFALNWLSKIPRELVDQKSKAWNKGRIHYGNASVEVADSYSAQYGMDMEMFLNARAKEMVGGGLMVLIMPSVSHGVDRSEILMSVLSDFLGSTLMDMVNSGLITEAPVDSFNLPMYSPTVEEIKQAIDKNGCFSIEIIKVNPPNIEGISLESLLMILRSATEEVFRQHFGQEVVDEMFKRASKRMTQISELVDSSYKKGSQLFAVLKRK